MTWLSIYVDEKNDDERTVIAHVVLGSSKERVEKEIAKAHAVQN